MNEPIKIGDMVVLVRGDIRPCAYRLGLRLGAIGTVVAVGLIMGEVHVDFSIGALCAARFNQLRRIPPPERGNWDDCAWRPTLIYGLPS